MDQPQSEPTPATTTPVPRKSAAEVLFGDSASPPAAVPDAPVVGPGAWTTNVSDFALYGSVDPPTELFSPEVALRPALQQRESELMTVLSMGQAERIARHRDAVALVRETGIDAATTGARLYDALTDAEIAAAHGRPVDDVKGVAVFEDMNRQLLARYGPERGEAIVRAVDGYVATHPRLKAVLETPGIATTFSFTRAFEDVVEHVRRQGNL